MVSPKAYNRRLNQRLSLNRGILKNKYWLLPVEDKGRENFTPVGRGVPSSELCGKWMSFKVCKNVEGHEGVNVGVVDCSGKVVVRHRHMWCHKSTCPICFIRGWSVRGARSMAGRLEEGVSRGFGTVEHILVSVNLNDYDLSEKVLRRKSRLALKARGVVGGGMIFHGFRMDRARGVLVWSPHYHVLGFLLEDYSRCRECERKWNCLKGCGGFDDKAWRCYQKDGYYVKVFAERETVFGTAFYQLHHATVKLGIGRFHAVTWFGICGNRKYSTPELEACAHLCPACGDEMARCAYMGKRVISRNIGDVDYKSWFVDDEFDESGEANYVEVVGGRGLG